VRELFRDGEHLVRLAALFAVGILVLLVARAFFVPAGFGELGHFRPGAIDDSAARTPVFAGRAACSECHDEVARALAGGAHARVGCESCHGALAGHAADPDAQAPAALEAAPLCARCHAQSQSGPARQPRVDLDEHSEGAACTECHTPHSPAP
jgi:hypothetical protein